MLRSIGKQSGESVESAHKNIDRRAVCCRIRTETLGGAWCPKERVSREAREYLQIDLGQLKVVTLVETQGRFGNGQVLAVTSQLAQLSFLPGSLNRVPASVGVKARMSRMSGHMAGNTM